jgi:predicted RNase H-like nuclease (RuvC/YqgF family)
LKDFAESFSQAALETKISALQADIKRFDSQISAVEQKIVQISAQVENRTKIALKITERDRKIDSLTRLYATPEFSNV